MSSTSGIAFGISGGIQRRLGSRRANSWFMRTIWPRRWNRRGALKAPGQLQTAPPWDHTAAMRLPVLLLALAVTTGRAVDLPGQRPDGSVLLPNQWVLRPVGTQIPLGDFPVNLALHPGGKYGAVLHCGHSAHEVVIVDL